MEDQNMKTQKMKITPEDGLLKLNVPRKYEDKTIEDMLF